MIVSDKVKITNNKTEQNKPQSNLDRQQAKISDLPSGKVGRY